MDNEFKWIESIERGTASLNGIIDASRWMEAEIAKRKRTQRIALVVLAVVFVLLHILTLVGFIFFSVTIANTRPLQGHPLLFGLLTFFCSYGVGYAVSAKLTYSLPLAVYVSAQDVGLTFQNMSSEADDYLFSFGIGGTIFIALAALGLLLFTGWIMEHKVNIK